ncbi:MAG: thermonuclease family protein [Pirellulales bacterium]|nr:thermonuclease family protein [Pirellulales bacterium]
MSRTCCRRMVLPLLCGVWLAGSGVTSAEELAGRVIDIPDSDVVVIQFGTQQRTVRLAGVDAPEMPQPYGGTARMALVRWASGRQAIVEVTRREQGDRLEGRVLVDGRDLGRDLVDQGLAWRLPLVDESRAGDYSRDLAAVERMARRRHRGLWSRSSPLPPWQWRELEAEAQGINDSQLNLPYDVNGRYVPSSR